MWLVIVIHISIVIVRTTEDFPGGVQWISVMQKQRREILCDIGLSCCVYRAGIYHRGHGETQRILRAGLCEPLCTLWSKRQNESKRRIVARQTRSRVGLVLVLQNPVSIRLPASNSNPQRTSRPVTRRESYPGSLVRRNELVACDFPVSTWP